jgi:phosphonate transport system substrate-binding protein
MVRKLCFLLMILLPLIGCDEEQENPTITAKKPKLDSLNRPIKILISPFRSNMAKVFNPLGQALSKRLGVKVTVTVGKTYQSTIDSLINDEADLYFLPALSYLRAEPKTGPLQILVSEEIRASLYDRAVLVVQSKSAIRRVEELAGRKFALVSRNSASGYLFPRVCLKRHKLDPDKILAKEKVIFAQNHDRALKLLLEDKVEVAATYDWAITENNGRLRKGIRVVAWSEPLPHSLVVGSPQLSVDEAELIRHSFLSLSREKAEATGAIAAMEIIGITGFSVLPLSALEPLRRMDRDNEQ